MGKQVQAAAHGRAHPSGARRKARLLAATGLAMALCLATPASVAAENKSAKEEVDGYLDKLEKAGAVVAAVYPPAGAVIATGASALKTVFGVLEFMGYFGKPCPGADDPTSCAILALEKQLAALEQRMQRAEARLLEVEFRVVAGENDARIKELRRIHQQAQDLLAELKLAISRKDQGLIKLAVDKSLRNADNYLAIDPHSVWQWTDPPPSAGGLPPPHFRPSPALEYYAFQLQALILGLDSLSDPESVKVSQYRKKLERHIAMLAGVNADGKPAEAPGGASLARRIDDAISCVWESSNKYPEGQTCHAFARCSDAIAKSGLSGEPVSWIVPAGPRNQLCQMNGNAPIMLEEELQNAYGKAAVESLAAGLAKLARTGTLREHYVGRFDMTFWTTHTRIYAVNKEGELWWFTHMVGEDRNPEEPSKFNKEMTKAKVGELVSQPSAKPPSGAGVVKSPSSVIASKAITHSSAIGSVVTKDRTAVAVAAGLAKPAVKYVHDWRGPAKVGEAGLSGAGRFVLAADGSRFDGHWSMTANPDEKAGQWTGSRTGGAGPGFAGAWSTTTSIGIPYALSLTEDAAGLRGTYVSPNGAISGVIEGTVSGDTLTYRWRNRQWDAAKGVFPAHVRPTIGGIGTGVDVVYSIGGDGTLFWSRHDGAFDGTAKWSAPVAVGSGWAPGAHAVRQVIPAGDGVFYIIRDNGDLQWYRHLDAAAASPGPRWQGPITVGFGWAQFVDVFSSGKGVLYAVKPDGTLLWYRHNGYKDGSVAWDAFKTVGSGWQTFKRIFSPGDGQIYAINHAGDLMWYRHTGYADGSVAWAGPTKVSSGWADYVMVDALKWGTPPPAGSDVR